MTEQNDPKHILQLKDALMEIWQKLPPEHQATITLVLLREVLAGEYGYWMWGTLFVLSRDEELADEEVPTG